MTSEQPGAASAPGLHDDAATFGAASGRAHPGAEAEFPVYVISVAAELAGMHPQTLRQYDRLGLVSPGRAAGRGRRYSLRDIAVLRAVQKLSHDEGVNLAGIKRILELEAEVDSLREQVLDLAAELGRLQADLARRQADLTTSYQRRHLPVPVTTTTGALVVWSPARRDR